MLCCAISNQWSIIRNSGRWEFSDGWRSRVLIGCRRDSWQYEEMDKPIMVINIARKHEVTSKMAKQREQLKNFVVRHCVGGNKLKKWPGSTWALGYAKVPIFGPRVDWKEIVLIQSLSCSSLWVKPVPRNFSRYKKIFL